MSARSKSFSETGLREYLGVDSSFTVGEGAPGHPCPICHSEAEHKRAFRPGDKPQIDAANKLNLESFRVSDETKEARLGGWVKSQKRGLTYAEKMGSVRGRYKTNLQLPGHDTSWSVYDRANDGDDQDNGAAARISAHKTHKHYGGDPERPEDLSTGFSPAIQWPLRRYRELA
jgi:hypothetical protein